MWRQNIHAKDPGRKQKIMGIKLLIVHPGLQSGELATLASQKDEHLSVIKGLRKTRCNTRGLCWAV